MKKMENKKVPQSLALSPKRRKGTSGEQKSPSQWGLNSSPVSGEARRGNAKGWGASGKAWSKKAFTLVELIIVITILAILATIAFVSFQGYSSQSRDSNRVATVKNIENGVNIFYTKTGKVPDPDDMIGTWVLNSVTLNYVGKVWKNIARAINLNDVPLDPRASEQYWYGVDLLKRYFQVGLTLESETAYRPWIAPSYAWNILEAKVQGNYQYPLKIGSTLYSLPSLLFLGSGALTSTSAFIVDNGNNVPYTFWGQATGTQSVAEVLKIITWTGNLSLTWITIPSMTSGDYKTATGIPNSFSWVANALGITDKTKLGMTVYGNDYIWVGSSSSSGGNPSNTNCVSWQWWNGSSCVTATGCTTWLTEITIWTWATLQTWSCMNLWATTVRDGSTQPTNCWWTSTTNCNSSLTWLWDYYQRGRNEPVNTITTVSTYNGIFTWLLGHNNFVLWETSYGDWWQNEAWNISPTRWTGVNPQWPCPSGWHVPSQTDWKSACDSISWTSCANSSITVTVMQNKLKLPFAGYRNRNNGYYNGQSTSAYYWSSSPGSPNSYGLYFNTSGIDPANNNSRANGFSVRCVKN